MTVELDLVERYEKRAKEVFLKPSPYIKPLWEKSEIETKIKELKNITKTKKD